METDFWDKASELNDLLARGGSFDDACRFCNGEMQDAFAAGDEPRGVYFGGRLAELFGERRQFDEAQRVYRQIWPRSITPVMYGLQFMKVLLTIGKIDDAKRLLGEMQVRLDEEKGDPSRAPAAPEETLSLLLAEGLLVLKQGGRDRLKAVCSEIVALAPQVTPRKHIDPELLMRLVQAREYEFARAMLDFIATARP